VLARLCLISVVCHTRGLHLRVMIVL
jgi:hypothetical protein